MPPTNRHLLPAGATTLKRILDEGGFPASATGRGLIRAGFFAADAASRMMFGAGFFDAAFIDTVFGLYSIGEDRLANAELHGRAVAAGGAAVEQGAIGAGNMLIPFEVALKIPDGATGDLDFNLPYKVRCTKARFVKITGAGAAGNSWQLKDGLGNAISGVVDGNIADKDVREAGTLDDAFWEIAFPGSIRITRTKAGGDASCIAIITGVRRL